MVFFSTVKYNFDKTQTPKALEGMNKLDDLQPQMPPSETTKTKKQQKTLFGVTALIFIYGKSQTGTTK